MNRKQIAAILVIILALIILIGLVYFMFLAPVADTTPPVVPPAATPAVTSGLEPAPAAPPVARNRVITKSGISEDELKKMAAAFVERYGSYSNQSGYQNIRELDVFMSQAMQAWARDYITQTRQSNADTSIYYGITTKAVVVETNTFSETGVEADFTVQTQRREAIGTSRNERTFQQSAIVRLVKEAGIWKVDRVVWNQ